MSCPFHRKHSVSIWKKVRGLFRRSAGSSGVLSLENLALILDSTVDSVITIDGKGIILAFNKTAEQAFGYKRKEVIGNSVNILMPEPFRSQHDTYMQNYLRTGQKKVIGIGREVEAKRKDGSTFPVRLSVSEVFTGATHLFTGIIQDLSAEKEAANVLKLCKLLEGELAAKNEYISILNHELRNPLTAIYGSLSLLNRQGGFAEKTQELVNVAFHNVERLMLIINEVLDITKVQSGKIKLDLTLVSLPAIVQESINLSKPFADQLEVELDYSKPAVDIIALSDYNRLIQVMMNLLSNAIKFSPPKGRVAVTVTVLKDIVSVSVQDFGKGIPLEFHGKIFAPFSQVTVHQPRVVGGTGLGLYICKTIIDQLNGKISFTSKENEGTTFFLELPIHKEKT